MLGSRGSKERLLAVTFMGAYYIGIDVGTGSARAGIFDEQGGMLGVGKHPILIAYPQTDFAEHSSEDIWQACGKAVREALRNSRVKAEEIRGLAFDATCSLVALDAELKPVTLSPTGVSKFNVIVWMDHRATKEADRINKMGHAVLDYVGKTISPEMQTPKLLWIKNHLPDSWKRAAHFFDLSDYLSFRATGDATRSLCTVVCKWTYVAGEGTGPKGWDASYWRKIGLDDVAEENFSRVGTRVSDIGTPLGNGLTADAARELGLAPGTPVALGAIDAHAGGIGVLGMKADSVVNDFNQRLALICGTSSCHMAVAPNARFIPGIWGPYYSAMVPGFWLAEGGQSATGALLDHVVASHPASPMVQKEAADRKLTIYQVLNELVERFSAPHWKATENLHIQPDFHGNRSPRANPHLTGMISGLKLSGSKQELARIYLSAVQSLAYGTRHILDEMNAKGHAIRQIHACGGLTYNPLFIQQHADITGCPFVLPKEPEAVLLGSAIVAAAGSGKFSSISEAMNRMSQLGSTIAPDGKSKDFHDRKYKVFHKMHEDRMSYEKIMQHDI
jgi:FGGY-family pentulose kinase